MRGLKTPTFRWPAIPATELEIQAKTKALNSQKGRQRRTSRNLIDRFLTRSFTCTRSTAITSSTSLGQASNLLKPGLPCPPSILVKNYLRWQEARLTDAYLSEILYVLIGPLNRLSGGIRRVRRTLILGWKIGLTDPLPLAARPTNW